MLFLLNNYNWYSTLCIVYINDLLFLSEKNQCTEINLSVPSSPNCHRIFCIVFGMLQWHFAKSSWFITEAFLQNEVQIRFFSSRFVICNARYSPANCIFINFISSLLNILLNIKDNLNMSKYFLAGYNRLEQ